MRTAADCEHRARLLYGPVPEATRPGDLPTAPLLPLSGGVLHVTAVGRDERGDLHTIALGPGAPISPTDFFVLNLARARADAIVTTGKILRDEPGLSLALQGPDGEPAALAAWRRDHARRSSPPLPVILTRGRDVDFAHPIFYGEVLPILFTDEDGARRLRGPALAVGASIVVRPRPGLRDTVETLRRRPAFGPTSIEAGPAATREIYARPGDVDELLLSIYEERPLPPDLRAGPFPLDEAEIRVRFSATRAPRATTEPSGRWSFHRLLAISRGAT